MMDDGPAVLNRCNSVYGIAKNGEVLVSMRGSDFYDLNALSLQKRTDIS